MKALVVGSANSALVVLERLVAHGIDVVAVYGQVDAGGRSPAGRADLGAFAARHELPFQAFTKIGDHLDDIRECEADIAFVVGISQIVDPTAFAHVRLGAVGFHPTRLPQGRGRAPLAWLVLGETAGAATFFRLGQGADDGDIIVQEPFEVEETDTATSLSSKVADAIRHALDRWFPELERGVLDAEPQDEGAASWLGVRRLEDGRIDWRASAASIVTLTRASAHPYPGAFTIHSGSTLFIDRAVALDRPIVGVAGRVVETASDGSFVVAAGDRGLVHVLRWRVDPDVPAVRVGTRLGLDAERELRSLRAEVAALHERLAALERGDR